MTTKPGPYRVDVVPTPGRFTRVGEFGTIEWREDCARCTNCVKLRCVFDAHRLEAVHDRDPGAPLEPSSGCRGCLSCVQRCTKGILSVAVNPAYLEMGDAYWTPDILVTTWDQAETGELPVSGAGRRGRFGGPGFDSIWTDVSQIVRPARDATGGGEHVGTSVAIGASPIRLELVPGGEPLAEPSRLLEIQLPAILDLPIWPLNGTHLAEARAVAARALGSLAVMTASDASSLSAELLEVAVPLLDREDLRERQGLVRAARMIELPDGPEVTEQARAAHSINPQAIVAVRLGFHPSTPGRVAELARAGIEVLHLCADQHGRECSDSGKPGRHLKDTLREVHGRLVIEGVRDAVTLIAGGGIALAEHMSKAILCGADLVAVDAPLIVALGCRLCRDRGAICSDGRCPAGMGSVEVAYASQRMVNLMGAWHGQLVEVLAAMGIREVRRLRGEVGRAMSLEEMEKEAFGEIRRVGRARVRS